AAVNASGTSSGSASPAIVLETKPAAKPKSEKTYTLENDLVKITFSNIGGGIIKSCLLKRYSDSGDNKEPLELVADSSSYNYMSLSSPSLKLDGLAWKTPGIGIRGQDTVISFSTALPGMEIV